MSEYEWSSTGWRFVAPTMTVTARPVTGDHRAIRVPPNPMLPPRHFSADPLAPPQTPPPSVAFAAPMPIQSGPPAPGRWATRYFFEQAREQAGKLRGGHYLAAAARGG
jgi:hypothetical protein